PDDLPAPTPPRAARRSDAQAPGQSAEKARRRDPALYPACAAFVEVVIDGRSALKWGTNASSSRFWQRPSRSQGVRLVRSASFEKCERSVVGLDKRSTLDWSTRTPVPAPRGRLRECPSSPASPFSSSRTMPTHAS